MIALILVLAGLPGLQPTSQAPADAASFLAWHHGLEGPPDKAEDAAWRAYVYVQAGAEAEVRAAAAQLEAFAPDDPDAERFRLEADCWSPRTRAQGLRRAEDWLQSHKDADAATVARVTALQAFLRAEDTRAETVRKADRAASLLPLLSLVVFAGIALGTWKLLLRE